MGDKNMKKEDINIIKVTHDLKKLKEQDYKNFILASNLIRELNKKSRAV
jgi:ABC-type Mn2+/Zn2+ transport system ATPase subunit